MLTASLTKVLMSALSYAGQLLIDNRCSQARLYVIEMKMLEQFETDRPEYVRVLQHLYRIPTSVPRQHW